MKGKILILLSIAALLTLFSEGMSCITRSSTEITPLRPNNEINNKATPLAIDNQAPNITVNNLAGKTVALSDLRGKKVLLSFWSVWCDQCDRDMWLFEAVHRKYPEIQIMAVNPREDIIEVKPFIKSRNFTFPVYIDQTGLAASTYDVHLIPKTFLIDSSGTIKYIQNGAFDNQTQLENALKSFYQCK